jgi:hypothetical protein
MVDLGDLLERGRGTPSFLLLWHGNAPCPWSPPRRNLRDTAGIGRCKLKFTKTRCYRGDSESVGAGRCRAIASSVSKASTARS